MTEPLVLFLQEVGNLARVRRSGWWLAGVDDPESVAEHSFRTAVIAFALARREGADPEHAAALALFHDLAEARLGDMHRLAKKYVDWPAAEEKAVADQTESLSGEDGEPIRKLWHEARDATTPEARCAADADRLDCLLKARELEARGHDVAEWIRSSVDALVTESARALAQEALRIPPSAWHGGDGDVSS